MNSDERIERLELEVSRLRATRVTERMIALFAGAGLAAFAIAACKPSDRATPALAPSTREIHLTTEDGSQEAVLTADGLLLRAGGQDRVRLAVTRDGTAALLMRDSSGTGRAALQVTDGPVALSLLNPEGKDLAVLAAEESDGLARLELFGADHVTASVNRDGKGSLTVGPEGAPRSSIK